MEGQFWGNPLYDWEEHEKEEYSWWIDRLKSQTEIFDVVRIDHFRAFNDYWSIRVLGMQSKELGSQDRD